MVYYLFARVALLVRIRRQIVIISHLAAGPDAEGRQSCTPARDAQLWRGKAARAAAVTAPEESVTCTRSCGAHTTAGR